jgi:hypothetical protein
MIRAGKSSKNLYFHESVSSGSKTMSQTYERNGRFVKGGLPGPGRPKGARAPSDYLVRLKDKVPFETWDAVCDKAIAQALDGDARAREWLANYLIGRPLQAVALAEPVGSGVTLSMFLSALREAVPDPEAQYKLAAVLARMGREAAGDGPGDERPGPPRLSPSVPAGHEHHHVYGDDNSR